MQLLDSPGIPHEDVKRDSMRFMVGATPTTYSWDDVEPPWFLILHDGERAPKVSAAIDLATSPDYFSKQ